MKIISLLTIVLLLPVIVSAAYNDVQLNAGSTIQVTVGGSVIDLTVTTGNVQQLVVNASTIVLDMTGGSQIALTSTDRKNFSIDPPSDFLTSLSCTETSSRFDISLPSAATVTRTVTITPSGSTCVVSTSGSGGGSTASTATTVTTTETTTTATETAAPSASPATVSATPSQVAVTTPTPAAAAPSVAETTGVQPQAISAVFTSGLAKGEENTDVERLQKLLATDSEIYPEAKVTGYYGLLTEKAVQRFQMKHGVVSSASDPGYGYVGPKTRAKIEEVFSGATETVSAPSAAVSVSATLSRELDPGMSRSDVKTLQEFLNSDPDTRVADSGVGSPGSETEYYGNLTAAAVKKFQAKYGISTVGRVGPQTLQKLQELMSVSAPQSSVQTPSGISESASEPQDTSVLQTQLLQATARLQELQQQLQSLLGQ